MQVESEEREIPTMVKQIVVIAAAATVSLLFQVETFVYAFAPKNRHHAIAPSLSVCNSISKMNDFSSTLSMNKMGNVGRDGNDDDLPPPSQGPATVNIQLVLRNLANQLLLGSSIWTGGTGSIILAQEAHLGLAAVVFGIAGVVPMLALSRTIEVSESPYVAGLNLSTNMAVLRLFGPKPQPIKAFIITLIMSVSIGIVEETIFRGQLIPAYAVNYGDGNILVGMVLSTLLFAVLHTNPLGFFKGGDAFIDNGVLLILQILNGAIFACLYVLSGNLVVPIVTHTLYDFYTFYKTHMVDVAGQMQYAEEETLMPVASSNTIENKWVEERGLNWLKEAKQSFFLMDTNRDGELSRKELRVALFSYGITLSKVESQEVEIAADLDDSGSIDFDEYLEFIGPAGGRIKAVRNTLLGPT